MSLRTTYAAPPFHRYNLELMRRHVALTTKRTFGFVRLIAFIIGISRRMLFRKPALPYGVINVSAHDRRYALFRRGAVHTIYRESCKIPIRLASCLGNGGEFGR